MNIQQILEEATPALDWELIISGMDAFGIVIWPLAILGVIGYGLWSRTQSLKTNTFYDRVTFSLNEITNLGEGNLPLLDFRTQMEDDLDQFLPANKTLVERVMALAKRCTHDDMFMAFDDPRQQEMMLNSFSSCWLAAVSAMGDLAASMGWSHLLESTYVIGITFEPYDEPSSRKLRVMIIRRDLLMATKWSEDMFSYRQPSHRPRVHTLKRMQELWLKPETRKRYFIVRDVRIMTPGPVEMQ